MNACEPITASRASVASIAAAAPPGPRSPRAHHQTTSTALPATRPTPTAVPQYGSTFVNGASKSSCNGPRFRIASPMLADAEDHAPSHGW